MFSGLEVFLMQYVHSNLRDELSQATAGLSVGVRAGQVGLCTADETVRIRLAGEDAM